MNLAFEDANAMPSAAAAQRIDAACDRFEQQLQSGETPSIQEVLESFEDVLQPMLLRQLLLLQWDYDGRRHVSIDLDGYLARFPAHASLIRAAAMEHLSDLEDREQKFRLATSQHETAAFMTQRWEDSNYEIQRQLGHGGMGTVWLAKERASGNLVAMKILRYDLQGRQRGFERFRAEIQVLKRLEHPNIIDVLDVDLYLGEPFYTMEYCSGGSLADALRNQRPTPHESACLLETLARAVHAAHQTGIIHRDLKPGNVLLQRIPSAIDNDQDNEQQDQGHSDTSGNPGTSSLTDRFTPKLADFGLAKDLSAGTISRSEELLGSLPYMAPEQLEGSHSVGPAADVHALGAILYECLTGRPPFGGATPLKTIRQIVLENVKPPNSCEPRIHRDLSTICARCLEKDPADRYATAQDLANDLQRFLAGEPIRGRPLRPVLRLFRWGSQHSLRLTMLAVIFIVFALVVAVGRSWYAAGTGERDASSDERSLEENLPGSLKFDDNIAILPAELLHGFESGTIEFWIKLDDHPKKQKRNDVFLEALDLSGRDIFAIAYQAGYINVYDGKETTCFGRGINLAVSWNHICYVRDCDQQSGSVYLNGQLLGFKDFGESSNHSLDRISVSEAHIGQDATGPGRNYTENEAMRGLMSDLRIWNTIRTQGQIKESLHAQMIGTEAGLLANYQFSDTGDSRIPDATGKFEPIILGDFSVPDPTHHRSAPNRVSELPRPPDETIKPSRLATSSEQFTFNGQASINVTGKSTVLSDQKIVVDTSQQYELSVFAMAKDGEGGQLDPNSVHYIGFVSYDIDGHEIRPWNFMKHAEAVDTTLAVDLEPGDTTITLTDATGWYDGPDPNLRSFVWYGYENSRGEVHPDYFYTRNLAHRAWAENGIDGNVVTLNKRWNGPTLSAGEPVRQPANTFQHNYRFLAPGHVSEEGRNLWAPISGINRSGTINFACFRPGTHSIAALALADYQDTGTQLTLSDFTISLRQPPVKQLVER